MLVGYVDQMTASAVNGWAADTDAPASPVSVLIYVDDRRIATVTCDRERPDLHVRDDLKGHLAHGFRFEFSPPLDLDRVGQVSVRFQASGELLTDGQRPGNKRRNLVPILVTAPGRSGTTFLMNRLSQSPAICLVEVPPFEVRLLAYWSTVYRTLTSGPDFARSTDPGRLEGDGFRIGSNPFSHTDYVNAFNIRSLGAEYFGRFSSDAIANFIRATIDEYYARIQDDQGKNKALYFAEKGNNLYRPARTISRILYCEMKEIVIIRDPRDVFCSHMAYFRQGSEKAFNDLSFSCEELLRIFRSSSGQEFYLKYEDMISGNPDVFRKLSDFLAVPDLGHGNMQKETAIFQVHATSKSPTDSVGRWRSLPADDARRCNAVWKEFLDQFGYEC